MELVRSLDFVHLQATETDAGDTAEEIRENLVQGFKDLNQYKQGKLKTTPAKEFLHEL